MEAKVTWQQGMSFTGTAGSGFTVPLGTDPSVGGLNDGFYPIELMAVSLAGCTAMDVISILRKKQQEVTHFEVKTKIRRAETHPHVFTHILLEYHLSGESIDEAAVLRAIELSALKYCPAQAMLAKAAEIEFKYFINDSSDALLKEGMWVRPVK